MKQFNIPVWAIDPIFHGKVESEVQRNKINSFLKNNRITELYPVNTCKPSLSRTNDIDGTPGVVMLYNAVTNNSYRII